MIITVLFPIDLYNDISYIKNTKVFIVEEEHYFNRASRKHGSYKFNILKPVYHRATMKKYYDTLIKSKIDCTYIEVDEDWIAKVKSKINNKINNKEKNKSRIQFFDPVDRYIEHKINKNFDEYDIINTPRFLLTNEDLDMYDGALRQTSFYGWIRKYKNILMDKNGKPIGGSLTYDKENRHRPYKGIEDDVKDHIQIEANNKKYVNDAFRYVKSTFKQTDLRNTYESDSILKFPIDRKGAISSLKYFIKHNLDKFGDYQDVIIGSTNKTNSFVFHSAISPMLNIGLLTPGEVIVEVLKIKSIPINNIEGFIRQIAGWREFTRYMYCKHSNTYLNKNYFNATKKLDNSWYNATTNIIPVDICIEKAFKYGYLHHIERLMIIANYMTLSGIDPKEMYKWFIEFSIDSYDWVMEYNIYCMASYSDGGLYTSKPYISSSNYILKMSTYKKDNSLWIKTFDDMFWKFLKKHKTKIKKIARLNMLLKYADKK